MKHQMVWIPVAGTVGQKVGMTLEQVQRLTKKLTAEGKYTLATQLAHAVYVAKKETI